MNTYDITFIDEKLNREVGYDNVIQITFLEGHVNIICKENDIPFATSFYEQEYNKIIIERR